MSIQQQYEYARRGTDDTVVVEGVHAFKHAARFGAHFVDAITDDKAAVVELMQCIATEKDVEAVEQYVREVDGALFRTCTTPAVRTGLVALAHKPSCVVQDVRDDSPIIFVEDARDINNVGAVVRVAAAWGAAAVACAGTTSPWHVAAIRAGAGLQWAIPIFHVATIDDIAQHRTIYACDADGIPMSDGELQKNSVLVFGTERNGISATLKKRADRIVAIPMQPGVSSMNLATSVAALLYGAVQRG